MNNLPKIFWMVLIFTLIAWASVGLYFFTTRESIKVQGPPDSSFRPSPTTLPQELWQIYQAPEFSLKYPKDWSIEVGQTKYFSLTLSPSSEERHNSPYIVLVIGENRIKISALKWAELEHPQQVKNKTFQSLIVSEREAVRIDEATKSAVYINDKSSGKMYIFLAYRAAAGVRELSSVAREKFLEIVSKFRFVR